MVRDSVSVMESEEFNVALIATAIDPASTHESLAHLLHTGAGDLAEGDPLVQESLEWRAVWDNREDPWKALPYLYSYVARGEPEGEEEARGVPVALLGEGVPVALLGEEDVANDLASIFAQEWSEDIYRQLFVLVEAGGASGLENGREVGTRDALARFLERKREGIERALTERMRPKPRETAAKVAPREAEAAVAEATPPMKRGRGRSRKQGKFTKLADTSDESESEGEGDGARGKAKEPHEPQSLGRPPWEVGGSDEEEPNPEATPPVKRGRGRPRKQPNPEATPPKKRGPGRPRKQPNPAPATEGDGGGEGGGGGGLFTALDNIEPEAANFADTTPKKRGPGRPRKRDSVATGGRDVPPAKKRGPGRPRKNLLPAEDERPPSVWEPKFRKWQKLVSLEDAVNAALKNPEEYRIPTILPKSMRARAAAAVKVVAKHKRRREEGRGR
ncbi:hypothetical protein HKI87_02g10850 [Chloropicon roscoffensis]|uniref:Uncharacterized protein n=1 Tax=Chloropicon roscoffensis TaxID=1461544 RepID=A0AAX4P0V2_9CHLO